MSAGQMTQPKFEIAVVNMWTSRESEYLRAEPIYAGDSPLTQGFANTRMRCLEQGLLAPQNPIVFSEWKRKTQQLQSQLAAIDPNDFVTIYEVAARLSRHTKQIPTLVVTGLGEELARRIAPELYTQSH